MYKMVSIDDNAVLYTWNYNTHYTYNLLREQNLKVLTKKKSNCVRWWMR